MRRKEREAVEKIEYGGDRRHADARVRIRMKTDFAVLDQTFRAGEAYIVPGEFAKVLEERGIAERDKMIEGSPERKGEE